VIGGITGVMVAAVPFDMQAHDSYFVVGHFHYVLIGGVAFPIFAGIYYWFPKFTGKMLDERLGRWNFWLLFVGVNVTFFPMHIVGLMGMPRRIYTYEAGLGWEIYNLISTVGVFIIVPGMAVFVWNVIRSYRRGAPAGANPWSGDTLEWATPSPPAEHGWSILPIVHSRHPLWDQDDLHSGPPHLERFVRGLGEWPLRWRAAVIVGTASGRPQEVFRVADPSIWPLICGGGVLVIFFSELVKLRWGIAAGVAMIVVSIIGWNWPQEPPITVEEEAAFEREHRVPVNAGGSVVVAAWGTGIAILFFAIALSSLLLSYFYLRLENPVWPPPGITVPDLTPALTVAVLMVASRVAVSAALRRVRAADQGGFLRALAAALVLTGVGAVVQGVDIAGMTIGPGAHAYGSIFATMTGFAYVVIAGAMLMGVMVLVWAIRGHYDVRRHAAVANVTRLHTAAVIMWLITFGVLYLGPRLT
jgi:cytochrome c oxidase subunit I+III